MASPKVWGQEGSKESLQKEEGLTPRHRQSPSPKNGENGESAIVHSHPENARPKNGGGSVL